MSAGDASVDRLRRVLEARREGARSATDRWRVALAMALYAGAEELASEVLREAAKELSPLAALDQLLAPAMHDIGTLWECNEIDVSDEHLATAVAYRLLDDIGGFAVREPAVPASTVLLCTGPSELHTMAMVMAAHVVRAHGHYPVNLSGALPLRSLRLAVQRHQPEMAALSATVPHLSELTRAIGVITDESPSTAIVIGGAAAMDMPSTPGVHHAADMEHFSALLAQLTSGAQGGPPKAITPLDAWRALGGWSGSSALDDRNCLDQGDNRAGW